MAAIMGAISAYIQMEKQPPSVTTGDKPQLKINRVVDFQRTEADESTNNAD